MNNMSDKSSFDEDVGEVGDSGYDTLNMPTIVPLNSIFKSLKELKKDNIEIESQIYLIAQLNLDNPKLTYKELNSNPALGLKCFTALKDILQGLNQAFL